MFASATRRWSLFAATVIASAAFAAHPQARAAAPPAATGDRSVAAGAAAGHSRRAWPGATWVGTWSATPLIGSGSGFTDRTLRETVHVSMGGDQVRIRLTNTFGTDGIAVDDVTAGLRSTGAGLVPGTERAVTFGGARGVVLAAGAEVLSDPVRLAVAPGQDLTVSLHVPGPTGPATRHSGAYATNYSAPGDHAGDTGADAFTSTMSSWYLLDGVDVRTVPGARAVVALGDSITDGTHSTVDANRRYPDDLARRLRGRRLSVLNAGASGNRLLTDAGGSGVSAQARFDRDVLAQSGVRDVIVLEGINDIGHDLGPIAGQPVTVRDLTTALANIVRRAHAHGLRVIGGTLTPIGGSKYDTPKAEADRQAVNTWIRTSGVFDAVVDFDAAVRDPADPGRYLPAYDSGDHLHPNDAGYQAMADAIDLRTL